MGLAPYGEPKYVDLIYRELIDLKEDGSFTLNQKYFNYLTGLTMTNGAFDRLFGGPPREPETKLTQREMDLARSVQVVCEEVMLRMARTVHRETGLDEPLPRRAAWRSTASATAGSCARGRSSELWIQPAAGDAGGALGVAQLDLAPALQASPARSTPGQGRDAGRLSRARRITDAEIEAYPRRRVGAPLPRGSNGSELLQTRRADLLADGEGGRLVQRPHGVRPARAGRPQHPGRPAQPADAGRR